VCVCHDPPVSAVGGLKATFPESSHASLLLRDHHSLHSTPTAKNFSVFLSSISSKRRLAVLQLAFPCASSSFYLHIRLSTSVLFSVALCHFFKSKWRKKGEKNFLSTRREIKK
jgi:hypothetical protein